MRRRRPPVLAAAAVLGCTAAVGPPVADPRPVDTLAEATRESDAAIDSIAAAFLGEGGVAGFSIGVMVGAHVLLDAGYGRADLEHGVTAGAETVYRIGSLTKPMTAVAIMQLAERGQLRVDDPLGEHLPDYPPPGSAITIRQLLSMTSGIPNYTMDPRLDYFRDELAHDSVTALFRDRPLLFQPGTRYHYSNSNYYLLGLIIERLSGQRYEEYIHDHIVAPLGLTATSYCINRPLIPHRSAGYRNAGGELVNARPVSVAWAWAAGAFCSTVADQLQFIRALGSGRLITPASFAQMSEKTRLDGGVESGYGYGLAVDELGGHRQLSHSGSLDGAEATMSYFPDDSLIVVVLSNTEASRTAELKERIARHLLGVRRLTRADVADVPLGAVDRARYVGAYLLETMGVEFVVSEADDRLRLSIAGQTPLLLLHQGGHRFLLEQDLETSLQFTVVDGRATGVLVRTATGNLVPGTRIR